MLRGERRPECCAWRAVGLNRSPDSAVGDTAREVERERHGRAERAARRLLRSAQALLGVRVDVLCCGSPVWVCVSVCVSVCGVWTLDRNRKSGGEIARKIVKVGSLRGCRINLKS